MRIFEVMQSLSRRKRILCVSALCSLVILGVFVYYLNTQKSIIIERGGNTAEMTKAVDLLIENNIDAKLSKGGTVLAVPEQSLDDARLLLAANCVFTSTYTSELVFSEDSDEKTREQIQIRAQEDIIEKAIEALEGVDNARVLLSIPDENEIISAQDALPCATVILDAPNGLSDEQLNDVAEYITKCIADMKLENISIVAPDGNILFGERLVYQVTGSNEGVNDFLTLQRDSTGYDPDICYNITPHYISENSDFRIFKYDNSCASFLLYNNEIFPMGGWFGGFGVTDMKLADMDKDNEMELYFTFSSGSGIHRSQAGYFNPKSKEIVIFDYSHMNEDMVIVSNSKNGLSLYKATISQMESFVNFTLEPADYIADIVFEDNSIALSFPVQ